MNPEKSAFLNLERPPARLKPNEAGWYLGFEPHDIPLLVRLKLLRPLGHPPPNATKHFSLVELELLRADPKWLARATDALHAHWCQKNQAASKSDPAGG